MTYFSARLPVLYPTDAEALFTALEDHNVPYALLDGTKDVWVRDFMPVRTRSGRMLSFRYEPSYLAGAPELRTDFRRDMALQLTPDLIYSAINLDGGNVVLSPSGGAPSSVTAFLQKILIANGKNWYRNCQHCWRQRCSSSRPCGAT